MMEMISKTFEITKEFENLFCLVFIVMELI